MSQPDHEKKRFISALKGKASYFDLEQKVIYLYEKAAPTRPGRAKALEDLEFKINGRNVFTAYLKDTSTPVMEQINGTAFRLLDGWSIDPASRNNIIHAGWTEETNEFDMQRIGRTQMPVRKFRKFLALENKIGKEDLYLEYIANTKDPDRLIREPLEVFEDTDKERYVHAVVDITESTHVQVVKANTKALVFAINLGSILRDGTLISFPAK